MHDHPEGPATGECLVALIDQVEAAREDSEEAPDSNTAAENQETDDEDAPTRTQTTT